MGSAACLTYTGKGTQMLQSMQSECFYVLCFLGQYFSSFSLNNENCFVCEISFSLSFCPCPLSIKHNGAFSRLNCRPNCCALEALNVFFIQRILLVKINERHSTYILFINNVLYVSTVALFHLLKKTGLVCKPVFSLLCVVNIWSDLVL